MREEREFVVVGAGLLGLATAWALRRRRRDVVVLEQRAVGHTLGGSHGPSRIFRLGYDDPAYVSMARIALEGWRDLEADRGVELLHTTGQLSFGEELGRLHGALLAGGAPAEMLSAGEAGRRFPGLVAPGPAVFEPASGVLAAGRCLEAMRGAPDLEVRENASVLGIADDGRRVTVTTPDHVVEAAVAVCCAGPWTAALVAPLGLELALRPTLEQVAYFAPRHGQLDGVPVFVERARPWVYGLPTLGLVKLALHHGGPDVDLESDDRSPDPVLVERLSREAGRWLPGFDPVPVLTERCLYDNTPDEDFVLDRVGRVVIGAGTSGHGFKFGPLLGELLAALATGEPPRVPLDRFRGGRPNG